MSSIRHSKLISDIKDAWADSIGLGEIIENNSDYLFVRSDQGYTQVMAAVKNQSPQPSGGGTKLNTPDIVVGTFSIVIDGSDVGATQGGVLFESDGETASAEFTIIDLTRDKIEAFFMNRSAKRQVTICGPGAGCGCRNILLVDAVIPEGYAMKYPISPLDLTRVNLKFETQADKFDFVDTACDVPVIDGNEGP